MPEFHYTATDPMGARQRGTILADSRLEATDLLKRRGMSLLSIEMGAAHPSAGVILRKKVWGPIFGQVPLAALAVFFRQFATLVNAGLAMHQSLDTLTRQTRNSRLKAIVRQLSADVLSGELLSKSMQRYEHVFTPLQISLVRTGEEGGLLHRTLGQIADYLEREIELRRLLRRVTFYPKLVLAFAILMPIALQLILQAIAGTDSPVGGFLNTVAFYQVALPIVVAIFVVFRVGSQSHGFRRSWDWFKLQFPVLGYTLRQLAMAKFGRALGALYAGGVSLPRAIMVGADTCGNEYIQDTIKPAAAQIEQGRPIAHSLFETGCFPPMVLDMISTGEQTGELDRMLFSVADFYEAEAEAKAHAAGTVLGVVVLLVVAIYVGYLVMNFYKGYFGALLNQPP